MLIHAQVAEVKQINTLGECYGGEGGIRTPGPLTVNGFQDRRIRPLCHLSVRRSLQDIECEVVNVPRLTVCSLLEYC